MEEQKPVIEPEIDIVVEELVESLKKKEEIIRYQAAAKRVESNLWLTEMVEKIKAKQQELVNFEYYEKPEAYKVTLQELNELNNELEENITVKQYRDALYEANEIVQRLFSQLQAAVEEER